MFSNSHVLAAAAGVFVAGFSSIATGVNFIATTHMLRTEGMSWFRLPLFVWSLYATSLVLVLATPVLAVTLLLIIAERWFGLPIFDPAHGGDPLLFQHLFWFYSHPAVYIMILPAMGVVTEVITCFARRRVFGYAFMVYALVAIAGIGFFVWGHHMFVSGQSPYASLVFSFLSFVVAVPSAIKVFNWTATLYRGQISFEAPMLYALGFVGLFTIGGSDRACSSPRSPSMCRCTTPISWSRISITSWLADRCRPSSRLCTIGGRRSSGKLYDEAWARFAAILMFFGFNFTFFPQFLLGYLGNPRRYHVYPPEFQVFHVMSSTGASVLAAAYLLAAGLSDLVAAYGPAAGDNPWGATGLEWRTPLAAAGAQFPRPAHGRARALRLSRQRQRSAHRSPHAPTEPRISRHERVAGALREPWNRCRASERPRLSAYGFSSQASSCSSAGCSWLMLHAAFCSLTASSRRRGRRTSRSAPINTLVLLTSSFCMAIAAEAGECRLAAARDRGVERDLGTRVWLSWRSKASNIARTSRASGAWTRLRADAAGSASSSSPSIG